MRIAIGVLLVGLSGTTFATQRQTLAPDDEIVFNTAGALLSWCEDEARAHFVGKGVDTYQWTGRHFETGDTLHAEGKVRANGNEVPVTCRAAKGARERYASIEIGAEQ
jgi:hypothetical protein